jgi:polygalacturonase
MTGMTRRRNLLTGAALFAAPVTSLVRAQALGAFDVRAFGAAGDGETLDTPAINRAIDAAAAAGGGRVYFPAGDYLSHSIRLRSHVSLYLNEGATIIAADPLPPGQSGGYDLAEQNEWDRYQDFGHSHWHNSLIWGEGLENIAILGPGLIWGRGLSKGYGPGPVAEEPGVANKSIALKNCRNVTLRDFSILHGGHFGILATGIDNYTIDNLKIDTNRDGMNIDCCRHVHVSNCSINSPWDDAICLKSSYGLGFARATERVTITNCFVSGSFEEGSMLDGSYRRFAPDFSVPRTGRIKFGTESNGGFKNITISNVAFDGCQGLALETVDGGLLEDVTITNISMRDCVTAAIFMRLGARMRAPEGMEVGHLRRVIISNLVCSNSASRISSIISGIPDHAIEDVKLSNIFIEHRGGGTEEMAAIVPPELEGGYPEPGMFGPMPAHGLYVRHAKNLEVTNFEVVALDDDARPAFVLNDVQGAELVNLRMPESVGGAPYIRLREVTRLRVEGSEPVDDVMLNQVVQRDLI